MNLLVIGPFPEGGTEHRNAPPPMDARIPFPPTALALSPFSSFSPPSSNSNSSFASSSMSLSRTTPPKLYDEAQEVAAKTETGPRREHQNIVQNQPDKHKHKLLRSTYLQRDPGLVPPGENIQKPCKRVRRK